MAWNRPSESGEANSCSLQKRSGDRFPVRGAIAGAMVVVVAVVVAWWLWPNGESGEDVASRNPELIKEVQPAAAKKVEAPKPEPPKPIDPNARPTRVGEIVNGYIKLPSGRIHKRVGVITNSAAHRVKAPYEIFNHHSENEIAGFLSMKPGQGIVAVPPYNGRFLRDFLESLKEPIIPTRDDTPEQAELKRAVNEAKIELKAAYDRGEDIEQIMMDTRKEMMQLASYKQEIRHQLWEYRQKNKDATAQDVEDFVAACNKMLEKKGIAPMSFGPITRRKLMMKQQGETK